MPDASRLPARSGKAVARERPEINRAVARERPEINRAVALKYWAGLPAPFLVAKGEGRAAERIVELASRSGLPIVEDGDLAGAIFPLDLGAYVPEDCFEIVAKVFAFVKMIEEA
jgi:Uncharacterized homolog of the cytoplasmic domain of flagellar protein FhlB